ncbi:phenolic acid decarboxylase [Methylophilus sp.]|uniref:phenolic acid decarboxylase n=1 Tax=Methylophilus sp. TaxID=29541 RepID=UPI004036E203
MQYIRLFMLGLCMLGFFNSCFAGSVLAQEPYTGRFLFKYDGGSVYRVVVNGADSLAWQCIQGPEKGAKGIEKPQRFKVAEQIYFVSWTEKTGIQVSQVINLNTLKVYSTIIDGQERYVVSGNIVREK